MRIELDEETVKALDDIRRGKWSISGRGHSDTVRFLARYYVEHEAVEKLIEGLKNDIPVIMKAAFGRAMREALANLFSKVEGPDSV